MIKKLICTSFLLVVGGALMYYALANHVVRTTDNTIVVPKAGLGLADTYSDIREWTPEDFDKHPALSKALIENGHADLVPQTVGGTIRQWLKEKARELLD